VEQRKPCPDEFEIGAFLDGRLPPGVRELLDRHFEECDRCRGRLVMAKRVLAVEKGALTEDAPEYLVGRVVDAYPEEKESPLDAVIRLARESLRVVESLAGVSVLVPAPAAVMRQTRLLSPNMVALTKVLDKVDVECDIEKVGDHRCNIKVMTYLPRSRTQMSGGRVELLMGRRLLASSSLRRGEVLFEDLGMGRYMIKVLRKGEMLGTLSLRIE
jgi:hypothetical protein